MDKLAITQDIYDVWLETPEPPRPRRIPSDFRWLRAYIVRKRWATARSIAEDSDLVEFCLQVPSKRWQRLSMGWAQREHRTDLAAWARKQLKGSAVPLLRDALAMREQEVAQLQRRLAQFEDVA